MKKPTIDDLRARIERKKAAHQSVAQEEYMLMQLVAAKLRAEVRAAKKQARAA